MAKYATEHADALADLTAAGAAVTFTRVTQTHNAETGGVTPAKTTIAGYAIETSSKPTRFATGGLVLVRGPVLLFAPTTYGSVVLPDDACTWGGAELRVVEAEPIAPDGTMLMQRIYLER